MAKNTPAFQFYPADFLGGTAFMSAETVGIYIRLLCHQWVTGHLPSNCLALARTVGVSSEAFALAWVELEAKFVLGEDGNYRNQKLEDLAETYRKTAEKRAVAGREGGKGKANAKQLLSNEGSKTVAIAKQMPEFCFSKTEANLKNEDRRMKTEDCIPKEGGAGGEDLEHQGRETRAEYPPDFERFWAAFPRQRRTKKAEAFRIWRVAIRGTDPETIIGKTAEYARSDVGRSKYAVMPSVWLNGKCWQDDPEAWNSQPTNQQAARFETAAEKRTRSNMELLEAVRHGKNGTGSFHGGPDVSGGNLFAPGLPGPASGVLDGSFRPNG